MLRWSCGWYGGMLRDWGDRRGHGGRGGRGGLRWRPPRPVAFVRWRAGGRAVIVETPRWGVSAGFRASPAVEETMTMPIPST